MTPNTPTPLSLAGISNWISDPLNLLMTIIGLLAIGFLAFWWKAEREQTNSAADTIERVGDRADEALGGFFGAVGSLMVVLVSIGITIGDQLIASGAEVIAMVGEAPQVLAGVFVTILGALGFSGFILLKAEWFLIVGLLIVALGVAWRRL